MVVPSARERYLAEIADTVRGYHAATGERVADARRRQHLLTASDVLDVDVTEHLPARDPLLDQWPDVVDATSGKGRESLSGTLVPRVAFDRMLEGQGTASGKVA